ncbi:hypothetical protein AA3250_2918 [Gluconobacter albidus NBRC 3250]|nr:hypothetical protein AA3250_2918 [Gluconobacter albidus NBRC 3250]
MFTPAAIVHPAFSTTNRRRFLKQKIEELEDRVRKLEQALEKVKKFVKMPKDTSDEELKYDGM